MLDSAGYFEHVGNVVHTNVDNAFTTVWTKSIRPVVQIFQEPQCYCNKWLECLLLLILLSLSFLLLSLLSLLSMLWQRDSALMYASERGHAKSAKMLLDAGADVNASDTQVTLQLQHHQDSSSGIHSLQHQNRPGTRCTLLPVECCLVLQPYGYLLAQQLCCHLDSSMCPVGHP